MKIAFLGTGLMGAPMAERLAKNGFIVYAFNRTAAKAKHLENSGVKIFEQADMAMYDCDVIITMVSDYKAVNAILFSDFSFSFKGKTVIQMSTISPEQNLQVKKEIEAGGGSFIEAPVLGGVAQAQSGELIVMVGSSLEQFQNFKKIFSVIGNNVQLIGEVGKASAIKLAYNQLIGTMNAAFCMSLGYIKDKGINQTTFMEILRTSTLYAPAFDKKLDNYSNRDYDKTNFSVKLLLKDMNLAIDEFEKSGIDCLTVKGVKFLLERAIYFELGEKDYSAMYDVIAPSKE